MTISLACNFVFRDRFLGENKIGNIPTSVYRGCDIQSVEAQKWMKYLEIQRGVKIRSTVGGEERIGKFKVDGTYYDANGQKVLLECAGCFWHGCSKCYSGNVENPQKHKK